MVIETMLAAIYQAVATTAAAVAAAANETANTQRTPETDASDMCAFSNSYMEPLATTTASCTSTQIQA